MVRGCIRDVSWECWKNKQGKTKKFQITHIPPEKDEFDDYRNWVQIKSYFSYEGLLNCRECPYNFGSMECKGYRKRYHAKVINT